MPFATTSGTKTVTRDVAPHLTGAVLTALLAVAPENLTVIQFHQIEDALSRVAGGGNPSALIGGLLK